MSFNSQTTNDVVGSLHDVHERIAQLIPKLEEADRECANAARDLAKLGEMSLEQQRQLRERIRAANRERDAVAQRIDEAMSQLAHVGEHAPQAQAAGKTSPAP